jgi:hypothetical protein
VDLATELRIDAPPARVWDVLSDLSAYPDWNPFLPEVSGELREGARLRVVLAPPGSKRMAIRPKVLRVEPGKELRWKGRLPIPGLFAGEHSFLLEPDGAGTRFVHREHFSGLLVPLLRKSLDGHARLGFEAMNRALKARVETAR